MAIDRVIAVIDSEEIAPFWGKVMIEDRNDECHPVLTKLDNLAPMLLTTLQGGLLLTRCRKETSPLGAVLDAMLAYIQSFVI